MYKNAGYEDGVTKDSLNVLWLMEILKNFDQEMRQNFLFFVTGSYKVPIGGFMDH